MRYGFVSMIAAAAVLSVVAVGQQKSSGHPDFSGIWAYSVDQPPNGLKQTINGKAVVGLPDLTGRRAAKEVQGALPSQPAPQYKPEFLAKVKELDANQSRKDGVFYCGRPGVPRLGPPRKVVQSANEMIFLYEDMSGDTFRIVPINGKHNPDIDPSFNGDAIGRWDGNAFVVESVNFVDETWFGELGYFHSDKMKVIERLWMQGDQMAYQVTVEDPKVLAQPWTMAARLIKRSDSPLLESPKCIDSDGALLTNSDHHGQR
jgi:hypothetical protein